MNSEVTGILEALDFSRVGVSLLVLLFAIILGKGVKATLFRTSRVFPDWKLKLEQIGTLSGFIIVLGSISLAVFLLFRSKEAAIAIGGSIGLAFAIGAKDIAASLLSGLFVVFDRSFQVGDRIKFGEIYGDVIAIGVRSTRVRTLDDSIVTIPNSQFMNTPVVSANAGALDMQVEVDIHVQYGSDLAKVKKLLIEAAVASRFVFLEKPIQVLFKDVFVDMVFCTRARVKAYVVETIYEKAFESDLTERFQRAFKTHNILAPAVLTSRPNCIEVN